MVTEASSPTLQKVLGLVCFNIDGTHIAKNAYLPEPFESSLYHCLQGTGFSSRPVSQPRVCWGGQGWEMGALALPCTLDPSCLNELCFVVKGTAAQSQSLYLVAISSPTVKAHWSNTCASV